MTEYEMPAIGGLGVAVIGCGYWGINYVRVLKELLEVETVVACDARPARLNQVSETFAGVVTTERLDDVLESERIHAVIVATPATAHFEVTKRALEAGKHVLVEKPLTTDSAQAFELLELADHLGLTMAVGHTFLHNAAVHRMKEYISNGAIGDLYYLYSRRTNLGPIRDDVNALWDLAPHDIAIFNYLLDGTPKWVSAVGLRALENGREDVGFVTIGYESGTIAHLHVSWVDPFKVRELVAVGSRQRIVFNDLDASEPVRVYEKGVTPLLEEGVYDGLSYLFRDGDILSPKIDAKEPLKTQVVSFFESLALGTRPGSDGLVGLSVVEVMRAIDRSIEMQGAPVQIDEYLAELVSARKSHEALDALPGIGRGATL
jgi:predicted dehydrogenase